MESIIIQQEEAAAKEGLNESKDTKWISRDFKNLKDASQKAYQMREFMEMIDVRGRIDLLDKIE